MEVTSRMIDVYERGVVMHTISQFAALQFSYNMHHVHEMSIIIIEQDSAICFGKVQENRSFIRSACVFAAK